MVTLYAWITIFAELDTNFFSSDTTIVPFKLVGEIECIQDPGTGSPLIPSVVSFLLDKDHKKQFSMLKIDKEKEIDVLVGYDAKQRIDSHSHSTIFHSKRFLGRDFNDDAVTEQRAEVEFNVALDIHNVALSLSSLEGGVGGGVVFQIPHVGNDSKENPLLGKIFLRVSFAFAICPFDTFSY